VYLARNFRQMTPPKDKYVVLAYTRPQPHGFVINSRPRERFAECSVRIAESELACLRYDSFLMCHFAFSFTRNALGKKLCDLSGELIERVRQTVLDCPQLENLHKERVISAE
jgi:hypothetical protein